jgi:hypothetical protein
MSRVGGRREAGGGQEVVTESSVKFVVQQRETAKSDSSTSLAQDETDGAHLAPMPSNEVTTVLYYSHRT